jgi:uncharacterized protein (TIGR00255 family)
MGSLRSMTGFAQGVSETNPEIVIELKSVNSRFLDIHAKLPVGTEKFEAAITKKLRTKLARGRVDVFLKRSGERVLSQTIKFDADGFNQSLELISSQLSHKNLSADVKVRLISSVLLEKREFLSFEQAESELELSEASVIEALEVALNQLCQMREVEGENLKSVVLGYIKEVKTLSSKIKPLASEAISKYSAKIQSKIAELQLTIPPDRLALEVALLAEKSDVSEEIDRLNSHMIQFEQALSDGGEVGRKLDFLTQEMNREINTTGSKSQSSEVTTLVIEAKSILEKIREQIQNIE